MTVYVVGVDPGASTGICILRDGSGYDYLQGPYEFAVAWLNERLGALTRDDDDATVTIVCERFVATGSRGARTHQPTAQSVIGMIGELAWWHRVDVTFQSPADAKRFVSNAQLRRFGLYLTASDVNQPDANDVNDAARHAVLLLARRYASLYERLLSL